MAEELLDGHVELSAGGDWEALLRQVPAAWAVSLLTDENDQPLQLLCLKDLRSGLRHRLTEESISGRRVNWKEIIHRVRWRKVASAFEADWVYLRAARLWFADTWRDLIPKGEAQFVHVDPQEQFPRFQRTTDIDDGRGVLIGPLPDKSAANKLIELLADVFDLCRYHHILIQYPAGKACAYKEMGKCPAPCDGSISIEQYRRLVELAVQGLADPDALVAEHTRRMEQAAAELRFETAVRIRSFIDQIRQLGSGQFRFARPIAEFAFASVQPAAKPATANVFLISCGRIEQIASLLTEPTDLPELVDSIIHRAKDATDPCDSSILSLLTRHLFRPNKADGAFIQLSELTGVSIAHAYAAMIRSRKSKKMADVPKAASEIAHE